MSRRQRNELLHLHGTNQQMVDALRTVGGVSEKTACTILETYPAGQGLSQASINALVHLGATEKQAQRIHTAFALVRFCDADCRKWRTALRQPDDVSSFVRSVIGDREKEHFVVVLLNARQRVIEVLIIAIGSLSQVDVHPREIFREAIRLGAHSMILAHNHPSGDAAPSDADLELTHRLVEVGRVAGIPILDHVVVTPIASTSLAQMGMMPGRD